jgi:hypothetical protein
VAGGAQYIPTGPGYKPAGFLLQLSLRPPGVKGAEAVIILVKQRLLYGIGAKCVEDSQGIVSGEAVDHLLKSSGYLGTDIAACRRPLDSPGIVTCEETNSGMEIGDVHQRLTALPSVGKGSKSIFGRDG